MCGIAALIPRSGAPDAGLLDRLTDTVVHRGPDGRGVFVDPLIGLGHRRLAIVDLTDNGKQPLHLGPLTISYNGEVYNHVELRAELEALGHSFVGRSDTEVIAAAYLEWGSACLHRFNGMWGLLIFDQRDQTLFMARDRFGVKPLYYWRSPEGDLLVASEIKQFSVHPSWKAVLNPQRAYDFLNWGLTDHTDETLFLGVHQLEPGCQGKFSLKSWRTTPLNDGWRSALGLSRWYQPPTTTTAQSPEAAAARFRELLKDSVRLRLRADVTVGSCLSGGLDSSSIVCLMNDLLREQSSEDLQRTFSARAEDRSVDEGKHIATVTSHTGVTNYEVTPSHTKLFSELDKIIWHQDEPFASTSIYAQWSVFRLAKEQHCTVMLDGQGADEQLAGYHGFFGARLGSLLRRGRLGTFIKELPHFRRRHGISTVRAFLLAFNYLLDGPVRHFLRRLLGKTSTTSPWLNLTRLGARPQSPFEVVGARHRSVAEMAYWQVTRTNLPTLLRYEDRDSMAFSIESRVPFLDYRLVEFCLELEDDLRIRNAVTKVVLRDAMTGILPDSIRDRSDKIGFATPESVWATQMNPAEFRQNLETAIQSSHGILNSEILEIFDQMTSGQRPYDTSVWRALCFGRWVNLFQVTLP